MNRLEAVEYPNVAVLGGGSGASNLAAGILEVTPNVTAIIGMADSGSSTGQLKYAYDILPPGDIRKTISAMSPNTEASDIFESRFGPEDGLDEFRKRGSALLSLLEPDMRVGKDEAELMMELAYDLGGNLNERDIPLRGHTVGNLVIAGLALQYHNRIAPAVYDASNLMGIRGQVLPVTTDKHELYMQDGKDTPAIKGEAAIDEHLIVNRPENVTVWLDPVPNLNRAAANAINRADAVFIGPGSPITSLVPVLAPEGIARTLEDTDAKIVAVGNLFTERTLPSDWRVEDYLGILRRYMGRQNFDSAIVQTDFASLPEGLTPIDYDVRRIRAIARTAFGGNFNGHAAKMRANDPIADHRSPTLHNALAVASVADRVLPQERQLVSA